MVVKMTNQTPEARLAAALHAIACTENTCSGMDRSDLHRSFYEDRANDLSAADPTLAADLALAEKAKPLLLEAREALIWAHQQNHHDADDERCDAARDLIADINAVIKAAKEASDE